MASFLASFRTSNQDAGVALPTDQQRTTTPTTPAAPGPPLAGFSFASINPFASGGSGIQLGSGSVPGTDVPDSNEPGLFNLSRFERIVVFLITLGGSFICYVLCFALLPILSLKPRKFAVIWTLGSILFIISFGVLQGWNNYARHLISVDRLWFTVSFFGSILFTLIFSLVYKSTILVIICCILQAISSIWYTVSYFPYGRRGLDFTAGIARNQVETWINS